MVDFSGYIPVAGRSLQGDPNRWYDFYKEKTALDLEVECVCNEHYQLGLVKRPAQRPDVYDDTSYYILVYGEVFSRLGTGSASEPSRLRASDIHRLFRSEHTGFLDRVKGSFLLFIYDKSRRRPYLISDPLSLKPLYYLNTDRGLLFSTSLLALRNMLAAFEQPVECDVASVIEYYLFDFTLGAHTMLRGIRELQAASLLTLQKGRLAVTSYADPFQLFPLNAGLLGEKEAAMLLTDILKKNIAALTEGPRSTALALTGGYDSRSIVALTGSDFQQYTYYSYGDPQSWDIKIPQLLARKNKLDYQLIDLGATFRRDFPRYARQAIQLGDGIAEASRANYLYVYGNFLSGKSSIISGLFGSELIKTPSSRGLFIDRNILSILSASSPELAFDRLYDQMLEEGIFHRESAEAYRPEVRKRTLDHPFVNNALSENEKLFYFILMVGARKYFAKEVRLERFFISNKTPFFDIDFIRALLRTPFPWVHNWTKEKSLVKNLKIHGVYANFIRQQPSLLDTISTHGFKPKYLLSRFYYPLLAFQFLRTKKKMARESRMSFDPEIRSFFSGFNSEGDDAFPVCAKRLNAMAQDDFKNYNKLHSLRMWTKMIIQE